MSVLSDEAWDIGRAGKLPPRASRLATAYTLRADRCTSDRLLVGCAGL